WELRGVNAHHIPQGNRCFYRVRRQGDFLRGRLPGNNGMNAASAARLAIGFAPGLAVGGPNHSEDHIMIARTSFRGSFTALVTPVGNGALDEKAFGNLVDGKIAEGPDGLVPVGPTGESPTLSHEEHNQIVEWCVE